MARKNAFGLSKYEPKDIFQDIKVLETLNEMFDAWLGFLGFSKEDKAEIILDTITSLKSYSTRTGLLDERLRQEYADRGIISSIKKGLLGRAESIYGMIHPFIGSSVLDMGCGPGEIAQYIHDRKNIPVVLTDIVDVDKRKEFAPKLPFLLRKADTKLPYKEGEFDTSLLIAVLHHADKPLFELEETARATNGNIIIVESIYGLAPDERPKNEPAALKRFYSRFHSLGAEQQRMYGTFLDWFLNKMILGNEVNCPYNFNTPRQWEAIFQDLGLKIVHKSILGIDQEVTPEYHVLYVVSRGG